MKKEIGGKVYVQVPETFACEGCAAERGDDLCLDLHDDTMTCGNKIWEEEKMRAQKTAVELVDELISKKNETPPTTTTKTYTDTHIALLKIKSAIEREHENKMDNIARLQAMYDTQSEHVAEAEQRIKRLEQNAVNMSRCEITMRPISELPDWVEEGCCLIYFDDLGVKLTGRGASHFCIMPLPKPYPHRKLKACPYCKAIPVKLTNYWNIKHANKCPIQSACVIMFDKCDIWGWE